MTNFGNLVMSYVQYKASLTTHRTCCEHVRVLGFVSTQTSRTKPCESFRNSTSTVLVTYGLVRLTYSMRAKIRTTDLRLEFIRRTCPVHITYVPYFWRTKLVNRKSHVLYTHSWITNDVSLTCAFHKIRKKCFK